MSGSVSKGNVIFRILMIFCLLCPNSFSEERVIQRSLNDRNRDALYDMGPGWVLSSVLNTDHVDRNQSEIELRRDLDSFTADGVKDQEEGRLELKGPKVGQSGAQGEISASTISEEIENIISGEIVGLPQDELPLNVYNYLNDCAGSPERYSYVLTNDTYKIFWREIDVAANKCLLKTTTCDNDGQILRDEYVIDEYDIENINSPGMIYPIQYNDNGEIALFWAHGSNEGGVTVKMRPFDAHGTSITSENVILPGAIEFDHSAGNFGITSTGNIYVTIQRLVYSDDPDNGCYGYWMDFLLYDKYGSPLKKKEYFHSLGIQELSNGHIAVFNNERSPIDYPRQYGLSMDIYGSDGSLIKSEPFSKSASDSTIFMKSILLADGKLGVLYSETVDVSRYGNTFVKMRIFDDRYNMHSEKVLSEGDRIMDFKTIHWQTGKFACIIQQRPDDNWVLNPQYPLSIFIFNNRGESLYEYITATSYQAIGVNNTIIDDIFYIMVSRYNEETEQCENLALFFKIVGNSVIRKEHLLINRTSAMYQTGNSHDIDADQVMFVYVDQGEETQVRMQIIDSNGDALYEELGVVLTDELPGHGMLEYLRFAILNNSNVIIAWSEDGKLKAQLFNALGERLYQDPLIIRTPISTDRNFFAHWMYTHPDGNVAILWREGYMADQLTYGLTMLDNNGRVLNAGADEIFAGDVLRNHNVVPLDTGGFSVVFSRTVDQRAVYDWRSYDELGNAHEEIDRNEKGRGPVVTKTKKEDKISELIDRLWDRIYARRGYGHGRDRTDHISGSSWGTASGGDIYRADGNNDDGSLTALSLSTGFNKVEYNESYLSMGVEKSVRSSLYDSVLNLSRYAQESMDDLEGMVLQLESMEDMTENNKAILEASSMVLMEKENMDREMFAEFEEAVKFLMIAENMRDLMGAVDFNAVNTAIHILRKELGLLYDNYLSETDHTYEAMSNLLNINESKELPKAYIAIVAKNTLSKRKILVDIEIEALKDKDMAALTDNEKKALEKAKELDSARQDYQVSFTERVEDFIYKIKNAIKLDEPSGIKKDKDKTEVLLSLDIDPE